MPRAKLFNEEEALQKAMNLFWEKGYTSTSMADLTEHLGIGKGSFYSTFKSKRAIFESAFELYKEIQINQLASLLNSESDVKNGIRKLLEFNLDAQLSDNKRKGCFAANICSELGGVDKKIRKKLLDQQQEMRNTLVKYLKKKTDKSEQIADLLILFLMGLNQKVKINRDRKSYENSISLTLDLIK